MPANLPEFWRRALFALALFAAWLASTPYIGIDHDARLYTLQALHWITPDAYGGDPWLLEGSQDRWSLFSPLYAQLLEWLGIEAGARWGTLAQGGLYIAAVTLLAGAFWRGRAVLLAALLVVSIPLHYAMGQSLSVSEGFMSARGLAVALSLVALAASLERRPLVALSGHALALSVHPIMALAPACVSLLWLSGAGWWKAALFLAGVGAWLLASGMLGALEVLSGEWMRYVEPSFLIFPSWWMSQELDFVVGVFAALMFVMRFLPRRQRRFVGFVGLVVAGGCTLSIVAGKLYPVVIVMQAQTWRALWLAVLVAVMALAVVLSRWVLRSRAPLRLTAVLAAVCLLVSGEWVWWCVTGLALAVWGAPLASLITLESRLSAYRKHVFLLAGAVLLVKMPLLLQEFAAHSQNHVADYFSAVVEGGLRLGAFGALSWGVWKALQSRSAWLPCSMVGVVLFLAVSEWDLRGEWRKELEHRYAVGGSKGPFREIVSPGSRVYWAGNPERVWFELGTSGYASALHATGLVFSRQRTNLLAERMIKIGAREMHESEYLEAKNAGQVRARIVNPEGGQSSLMRTENLAAYERMRGLSIFGLEQLCKDGNLDYVVDGVVFTELARQVWEDRIGGRHQKWALYDCKEIRTRV